MNKNKNGVISKIVPDRTFQIENVVITSEIKELCWVKYRGCLGKKIKKKYWGNCIFHRILAVSTLMSLLRFVFTGQQV